MINAFLLTRQWQDTPNGINLIFWFSSDDGPLKVVIQNQQAIFFINQKDTDQAQQLISRFSESYVKDLDLKSFKYEKLSGVYFKSQQHLYRARDIFQNNSIQAFESDIRPTDRFLTERFITGPASIHSTVGIRPIVNPRMTATKYRPEFKIMSIDIETAYDTDEIFSIAFISNQYQRTLIIGKADNTDTIEYIDNEKKLLERFIEWIKIIDPDIFIGWNVINFDFRFLQKKSDQLKIPLSIGRENSLAIWRKAQTEAEHYFLLIPGRVVLDGIDTLKSATYQFNNFSLEFVGNKLLGRGKLIHQDNNKDPLYKAKEIKRLFYANKVSLAKYNLEDCQLVWDIFEDTDLISFAIERARLTGLEMDRVGGSVAAFDNLYLPRLHRKGFIAPNIGDYKDSLSAPGGYVMNSIPGIYNSVLVLDYKSLYPSIIRTFKIDPYGRIVAKKQPKNETIPGFDGASFSKNDNILPDIIKQLWTARDDAKKHKNKSLSQAIKIIMNSFYGVLGTPGCRIHDARLTSSITKRSHEIIKKTVKIIEQQGYPVIYGDTDSVFVSLEKELSNHEADKIAGSLIKQINSHWETYLRKEFDIDSYLEMEYEIHFNRFFMPTVRGSEKGSKKRYAGLVINNEGERNIIFKGLETVRTDWTKLARIFQAELFKLIFNDQDYHEYIKKYVINLKAGKLDEQLIYRKRLRQQLKNYQKNIPPHAQAALKAENIFSQSSLPSRYKNASWIEYVITNNGPETLECQSAPLNYEHYIEKQLTPIANNILSVLGASIEPIIQSQYNLF